MTEELLNFKEINNILSYKYQYSWTTCDECMRKNLDSNKDKYNNIIDNKTGDYIKTFGINYENITLINFIIFNTDID